jgi:uncharacterized protein YhaN
VRITGFHVDGYGRFHDRGWTDLPPGLTVFHGPNEAGKSTLLSFVRTMLFGFKGQNTKDPAIPALDGGRHGGTLHVADEQDAAWAIERHGRELRLRDAAGAVHDEAALRRLLGQVGRDVFEAVFAFSLLELEQLGGLDRNALRDQLFASSLTGGGSSAHDALGALEQRIAALYPPASSSPMKDANDRLKRLRDERRDALEGQAAHAGLRAEEEARGADVVRLGDVVRERRAERDRLDRLERLWETLEPLARDRDERRALQGRATVGRQVPAAAARFANRRAAAEDARREVADRRDRRAERRDTLLVDERLVAAAPALAALSREAAGQRDRLSASLALRAERARSSAAAAEAVRDLGDGWNAERVAAVDAALPVRQAAARWGTRVAEADERAARARAAAVEARRSADQADEDAAGREAALRGTPQPPSANELDRTADALVRARAVVSELPVRRQVATQAEQALEALRRLAPRPVRRDPGEGARVPVLVLVAVLSVAVGIALVASGQPAGGAGLVVVGVVVAWVDLSARRARAAGRTNTDMAEEEARAHEARVREQEDRATAARQDVEELEARLADLAASAGLDVAAVRGPSAAEAVERRSVAVRALRTERDDYDEGCAELAVARAAAHEARENADAAARSHDEAAEDATREAGGWRSWAADRGLPHDLTAAHGAELLAAIERAQQVVRGADDAADRERDARAAAEAWTGRAAEVLAGAGRVVGDAAAADGVVDAVLAAHRAAVGEVERARTRVDLDEQLAADDAELERLGAAAADESAQLDALLREHGVADLEELDLAREATERRQTLDGAIAERAEVVRRVAGGGADGDALVAAARDGDVSGWATRRAEIDGELAELEAEQRRAVEARAEAATARRALEHAVDLPRIDGEIEQARADAAELLRDVRTAMRARDLIAGTLDAFVRDQQPAVLRDASAWFSRVTAGRYSAVRQVVGERGGRGRPALQVIGPRGATLDPAVLSRGTREQLYLCLRLALARATAGQATALPLVMDDVLVNFSPDRARAVAAVLAAVARDQQVLFFTCHPGTRDLLLEAGGAAGGAGGDAGAAGEADPGGGPSNAVRAATGGVRIEELGRGA